MTNSYSISSTEEIQGEILKEKVRRQSQLIQTLPAAIYTCDSRGYIKFYNKAAVELWGRAPEIGKDLWCGSWKIFKPDGAPLSFDECPMAKALKEGRSIRGQEILIERPDGVRRNIMPHPDPIFDSSGNVVEAVNMLVDITELKKKENELRERESQLKRIAEDLEKRVAERTKDLKAANTALKRTNEELEQFAFIASHDMQEPLRKIKTFSRRLEKKSKGTLDDDSKEYLDKIKSSSDRMEGLINDVLNYSRLSYLGGQFVKTDLNELLKNVLGDFEVYIEERKAVVKSDELPVVTAIPLQMNQLFHNLISNSLKFCKNSGPCIIVIKSRMLSGEEIALKMLNADLAYCEIIFEDNGIGFKQEFAKTIFNIFERLNEREKYEGTGIGLALCRKIAEIHHGEISAHSEVNVGTSFHVILPTGL